MGRGSKVVIAVVAIVVLIIAMAATDLYRTYRSARSITASEQAARSNDSFYAGTRLVYEQKILTLGHLPREDSLLLHWEVTYDSTNFSHGFTRIISLSEARRKRTSRSTVTAVAGQ